MAAETHIQAVFIESPPLYILYGGKRNAKFCVGWEYNPCWAFTADRTPILPGAAPERAHTSLQLCFSIFSILLHLIIFSLQGLLILLIAMFAPYKH